MKYLRMCKQGFSSQPPMVYLCYFLSVSRSGSRFQQFREEDQDFNLQGRGQGFNINIT